MTGDEPLRWLDAAAVGALLMLSGCNSTSSAPSSSAASASADASAQPVVSSSAASVAVCANNSTPAAATGNDDVVLTIERTMCLGKCPAYVVKIYADGRVTYTSWDGDAAGSISEAALRELRSAFEAGHFFELCDSPRDSESLTDFPRLNLEYWDGTRRKRVASYMGNPHVPAIVGQLGAAVDRAVDIERLSTPSKPARSSVPEPPRPPPTCNSSDPLCE